MHSRILAGSRDTVLVSLCLVSASSGAVASKGMPVGSFLRRPIASAQAFTNTLHTDPLVLSRYARLFRLTPHQVQQALADVHVMTLPQDDFLRVHYVKNGEQIGYRLRRVPKGTLVLAFSDGTPILIQVCGNPIQSHFRMPALLVPPEQSTQIAAFRAEETLDMKRSPLPLEIASPSTLSRMVIPQTLLDEPTPVVAGESLLAERPLVIENASPPLPTEFPTRMGFSTGKGWNSGLLSPLIAGLFLPSLFSGRAADTGLLFSPVSDFVPVVTPVVVDTAQSASPLSLPSVVLPEQVVKEWAMGVSPESPVGGGGGGSTSEGGNVSNPFASNGNSPFTEGTALTLNSVPELGSSEMMFGYLVAAIMLVCFSRRDKKK